MNGLDDITDTTRKTGMTNVSAAAAGTKTLPNFLEDQQSLDASGLVKKAQALDKQAAASPSNYKLRMQLVYAAALARDLAYTVASGRFHYALGVHTSLRGLYEGGRLYIDADV